MTADTSPTGFRSTGAFGPIVTVAWLAEHLTDDDVLVVDVRPVDEFRAAHIAGSIGADIASLRLPSSQPAMIERWRSGLEAAIRRLGITPRHRVVFTEAFSGTMAATGVWLLDVAGLGNGALLDGGLLAWQQAGHDLTADSSPAPTPSETEITLNRDELATVETLEAEIAAGTGQRIDTRSPLEHAQGAIPGAINIEWQQHLDERGALRSQDELSALYAGAGVKMDAPAATYCAGGFRASHTYVVLKALGHEHVRNYMPSWGEWSQRATRNRP